MSHGVKVHNEYAAVYPAFQDTPKAVIAAIAFSLAQRLACDEEREAVAILIEEWKALHEAGIVPQTPPKGKAQ